MKGIEYAHATLTTTAYLKDGFVSVYQEAFGGPPYFEEYTGEQVERGIWLPHIHEGVLVLALDGERVVGFGCAKPLLKSPPDIQEYLAIKQQDSVFPVTFSDVWYMSELGVTASHRGRGIAYELIRQRLLRIRECGAGHYVMRTASDRSNSVHMYCEIGSNQIPGSQDISSSGQVLVNQTQSRSRVYLYGSCDVAIAKIDARAIRRAAEKAAEK